ncbi:MAG: glutaredoxin family protein [Pseudomonadales bacterium]|nr:glutaredoxin family protein [Pseudomonadales bacterium]
MILDFYTTLGCHLCEDALLLLHEANLAHPFELNSVEISEDHQLLERYGIRIPVVAKRVDGIKRHSAEELSWPFDKHQLNQFLSTE